MKIKVIDQKGGAHEVDAPIGWTVMEAVRTGGLPFTAECGGCLSCGTCHVYVDEAWVASFPAPTEMETSMFDMAFGIQDNSRLSCQLKLDPKHEGLLVTLAPGTE